MPQTWGDVWRGNAPQPQGQGTDWGSWGRTALNLGGSLVGGERANKKNLQIAREQMAFQERMSNTSYQRAIEDMKLAGVNPMLAIGQGGASTPGGASATMQDVMSPAISGAQQARRVDAEMKRARSELLSMRKNQNLLDQQAKKTHFEAQVAENQEFLTREQARRYASENSYMLTPRMGMLGVDTPYEQVARGGGNPLWRNLEQIYQGQRVANQVNSAIAARQGLGGTLGDVSILSRKVRDFFSKPLGR